MYQLFEFPRHFEGKQDIDLYIVKRIRGLKKMFIFNDLFHPHLIIFFYLFHLYIIVSSSGKFLVFNI